MAQLTDDVVQRLLAVGKASGVPIDLPNNDKGVIVPEGYLIQTYEDHYQLPPYINNESPEFLKLESFIEYVKIFQSSALRIFGTFDSSSITAFLDYHEKDKVAPVSHRATLILRNSEEWTRWKLIHNKEQEQLPFAEFIEENRLNILDPDGATLLELVTNLESKTEVNFQSSVKLNNGTMKLAYQENQVTKGNGTIDVPTKLKLGLPVYRYGAAYPLEAFLRVRPRGGKVTFVVKLDNPHVVVAKAFADVCSEIQNQLGLSVLEGTRFVS